MDVLGNIMAGQDDSVEGKETGRQARDRLRYRDADCIELSEQNEPTLKTDQKTDPSPKTAMAAR